VDVYKDVFCCSKGTAWFYLTRS